MCEIGDEKKKKKKNTYKHGLNTYVDMLALYSQLQTQWIATSYGSMDIH